jgi:hypothetical protein
MAQFFNALDLNCGSLKPFLLETAERVKDHAVAMAQKHGRPLEYLASNIRKEDKARQLAQRDGVTEGLVCIFSILEPCRAFSFRFHEGRPFVQSQVFAFLLLLYGSPIRPDSCADQSWFPMQIQGP